jgi:site-specific recombinase XerD
MEAINLTDYKNYLKAKGYTSESTAGIIKTANKFLEWINAQQLEITTINYNDITAYIKHSQQRSIKTRTVQIIVINIKHYLNYLVESSVLSNNPALALKIKNAKRKTVYNILSTEELEHIYKTYRTELPNTDKAPPQILNKLARKRNKILLGLLIYQGVATDDIKNLEPTHLELREGKLTIPGSKRINERSLKLEPFQIFDFFEYINETRKQILSLTNKNSSKLFISIGKGNNLQNSLQKLTAELKKENTKLENLHQLRASVITNWLKQYNKRKVQYMAGHRYISSTEHYQASNIETLQEDLHRFYPEL